MIEIKIPEIGENITKGTVAKVSVASGDSVQKDQTLLELETEKATVEIPSTAAGTVQEILVKAGQDVDVGQVVVKLAENGGQQTEEKQTATQQPQSGKKETAEREAEAKDEQAEDQTPKSADKKTEEKQPADQKPQAEDKEKSSAREEKPAGDQKTKSGNQEPKTEDNKAETAGKEPDKAASSGDTGSPAVDVPAAPSVRRFAREIGINIADVPGSGDRGRISIEDVKSFAKQLNTGKAAASGQVKAEPLPDLSKWGPIERVPMSKIRQRTAERLGFAWATVPHVTQFDQADITEMEALRKKYSTPERKLTITPFLVKVIAAALKQFPQFNSSVDMDTHEIIRKKYIHIGMAVDTEHGLLVPVIRDADRKGILQIADEMQSLAQKARDKKLTVDEMQGGTFTITNLGGIGGTAFTPIINWPEVAILGVSRARMEPGFANDVCAPRLMLPLSLSYDHRVIDGADGARFVKWITDAIQQPFLLELNS